MCVYLLKNVGLGLSVSWICVRCECLCWGGWGFCTPMVHSVFAGLLLCLVKLQCVYCVVCVCVCVCVVGLLVDAGSHSPQSTPSLHR